ncbi:MAG: ATP-binding protein [Actinomycetota bacterium]|nr:ATP-binding protein [Actinomycetota bacterium]
MTDQDAIVRVSVPARADFVHVLRAVISSVASRIDMTFDVIEEVRIAVDEASTILLGVTQGDATLELTIEVALDDLTVTLTAPGDHVGWPAEGVRSSWPWRVMTGLCDDVELETSDRGASIRFVKRRGARAPA